MAINLARCGLVHLVEGTASLLATFTMKPRSNFKKKSKGLPIKIWLRRPKLSLAFSYHGGAGLVSTVALLLEWVWFNCFPNITCTTLITTYNFRHSLPYCYNIKVNKQTTERGDIQNVERSDLGWERRLPIISHKLPKYFSL